jgi:hypothetical protein
MHQHMHCTNIKHNKSIHHQSFQLSPTAFACQKTDIPTTFKVQKQIQLPDMFVKQKTNKNYTKFNYMTCALNKRPITQ